MTSSQSIVIDFVNMMSITAITDRNAMITNVTRIEATSAVATITVSRRSGDSRDEAAEEKSGGDG